jgi:hypothetical protein
MGTIGSSFALSSSVHDDAPPVPFSRVSACLIQAGIIPSRGPALWNNDRFTRLPATAGLIGNQQGRIANGFFKAPQCVTTLGAPGSNPWSDPAPERGPPRDTVTDPQDDRTTPGAIPVSGGLKGGSSSSHLSARGGTGSRGPRVDFVAGPRRR